MTYTIVPHGRIGFIVVRVETSGAERLVVRCNTQAEAQKWVTRMTRTNENRERATAAQIGSFPHFPDQPSLSRSLSPQKSAAGGRTWPAWSTTPAE
jgi:hypothetical protein